MLPVLATAFPCFVLTLAIILLLEGLRRKDGSLLYTLNTAAVCGMAMAWLVAALSAVLSANGHSSAYLQASAQHGGYLAGALVVLLLVPRACLVRRRPAQHVGHLL